MNWTFVMHNVFRLLNGSQRLKNRHLNPFKKFEFLRLSVIIVKGISSESSDSSDLYKSFGYPNIFQNVSRNE